MAIAVGQSRQGVPVRMLYKMAFTLESRPSNAGKVERKERKREFDQGRGSPKPI